MSCLKVGVTGPPGSSRSPQDGTGSEATAAHQALPEVHEDHFGELHVALGIASEGASCAVELVGSLALGAKIKS